MSSQPFAPGDGLLLEGPGFQAVQRFFEPRVGSVDCGEADFRDAAAFLASSVLRDVAAPGRPNADAPRIARTLATIAWFDMASAFSLWCQRMVLEYLAQAPATSTTVAGYLAEVASGATLGSTALAVPMAHVVSGAPLSLTATPTADGYAISGRVNWASNLCAHGTIIVSAAARQDGGSVVFAFPISAPGVTVAPFDDLIGMQGTLSTSLVLEDVRVPESSLISNDLAAFARAVRPLFLLFQSSYCWGLAARALTETSAGIRGLAELLSGELHATRSEAERLGDLLSRAATTAARDIPVRELVEARLAAARLATAATGLELRATGGRAYLKGCGTERRLREALFLPVQTPTEVQLLWELSQSA